MAGQKSHLSLLPQVSCGLEGVHVRVVAGPYNWAARSITLLTCYSSRVIYVYLGEFCYAQPFLRAPFKGIFMFEPALSNRTPPHNKPKSITASFSFGFFSPNLRNLLLFVLFFFLSFFLPRILFSFLLLHPLPFLARRGSLDSRAVRLFCFLFSLAVRRHGGCLNDLSAFS